MALALKALGYSLNTEDQKEIDEAKQLLLDVKPNVDTINSTYIEKASRGEIDFGMGWNGDVRRAIVELAKKDREMVYLVPDDSTEYWVDNWVIPTDAEHPVAAHKWIDYVLDPEAAGQGDELPPVRGADQRDPGRRPEARRGPDHRHRRRQDREVRDAARRRPRAWRSATGPTRSSRPPDHGGGRSHHRPSGRPRRRPGARRGARAGHARRRGRALHPARLVRAGAGAGGRAARWPRCRSSWSPG